MHISEGILSANAIGVGIVLGGGLTIFGTYWMSYRKALKAAVFSSLFFLGSLIHIPFAATSLHLLLNGLVGIFLGFGIFPAVCIALILQVILLGYGGFSTLGANIIIISLPGLFSYFLFSLGVKMKLDVCRQVIYFLCGFVPVLLSSLLLAVFLSVSHEKLVEIAKVNIVVNIPLMVIEGLITMFAVNYVLKISPGVFFEE